jgi:hypothetical protein
MQDMMLTIHHQSTTFPPTDLATSHSLNQFPIGIPHCPTLFHTGTKLIEDMLNSWIHSVEAYFKTQPTLTDTQKILVAEVHMEEEALTC